MLLKTAMEHFGSCAAIAQVLNGRCHASAVYQWQDKGVVPLWAARSLAEHTAGAVKVDPALYDKKERAIRQPAKRKRVA